MDGISNCFIYFDRSEEKMSCLLFLFFLIKRFASVTEKRLYYYDMMPTSRSIVFLILRKTLRSCRSISNINILLFLLTENGCVSRHFDYIVFLHNLFMIFSFVK